MKHFGMKQLMLGLLLTTVLWAGVSCGGDNGSEDATQGTTQVETTADSQVSTDSADETDAQTEMATQAGGEQVTQSTTEESTEDTVETQGELPSEMEVTVEGDVAHVKTPTGLQYDMSGYNRQKDGTATFIGNLTFVFPEGTMEQTFNRFTMTYEAGAPVKIYVSYQKGRLTLEHDYYLEAGKGSFSGVVNYFLDGNQGEKLLGIRVDPCQGRSTTFVLKDLTLEDMEVPSKTTYVSNGAYKLGVDLSWGGAINYLKDLKNSGTGINNLVNKHDTGRLIQQSFYGTAGVPGVYQPGIYGEAQWVYNPVQGGDQYNNASRLIDVQIGEDFIYVKSQPQDWSLDNQLTPSYMENRYTLTDDCVRVDNRFMDFSGWNHPYTTQELPALYTVSYLDTFVWYSGSDAWTGDALSYHDDLPFWGDASYGNKCSFVLREGNTETWSAWMNTQDDYGLGIYVPNVDQFKAGRYAYNGSKDAGDNACSYVAPLNIRQLVAFEALEYSYLLTTGSLQEIRDTFSANKSFSSNASLHEHYTSTRLPAIQGDVTALDFTNEKNVSMLYNPVDTVVEFDATQQAAKLTAGDIGDVYVTLPYHIANPALDASQYTTLRIEYMIPTTNSRNSYQSDLFICAGSTTEAKDSARKRVNLITDGEYHVLEVDLSKLAYWTGEVHKIRFDYFDFSSAGDVMYVKSITLS